MNKQFNIRLWFAIAGFGILGLIWAGSAWWLNDFMTRSLLERESEVSQEFFQSIVDVEGAGLFNTDPLGPEKDRALGEFAKHVASTPGVMRANIYSVRSQILWSTEPKMVGQFFNDNSELIDAFKGNRITEINSIEHHKSEYVGFGETGLFIEAYLPLRAKDGDRKVVGVVELYKFPTALNKTIDEGRHIIWFSGLAAALLAYATLYWIVQRGARVIEGQQAQMHNMQSAALVGELAGAVAHSLRNPMAAIRSSAELWRADLPDNRRGVADEIIHEIDRMNDYVRDLLDYANSDKSQLRPVDPMSVIVTVLARRDSALRRNNVEILTTDRREDFTQVKADTIMLEHALTSIVTNAIEAMPHGGKLDVVVSPGAGNSFVNIDISDTGAGIAPELMGRVSDSYFTTKSQGLGLGLALARGIIERWGGKLDISSSRDVGTTVKISLKKA